VSLVCKPDLRVAEALSVNSSGDNQPRHHYHTRPGLVPYSDHGYQGKSLDKEFVVELSKAVIEASPSSASRY